jgi:energy-coupling factor transporter ATP-binding protein EcfA2
VIFTISQRLLERTLHRSQLVLDRAWLLRHLKDALSDQMAASLIEPLLFGMGAPRSPIPAHLVGVNLEAVLDGVFTPDDYQRRAIERALREELLLVIGPPGTGKTDVLAATALAHLLRHSDPRILIMAHTNIALDNAIKRLVMFCQKAGEQPLLDERKVIRLGTPRLAELSEPVYKSVVLPLIIEEELLSTRLEIERLEQKRDQLRPDLAANQREAQRLTRSWDKEREQLDKDIEALGTRLMEQRRTSQKTLAGKLRSMAALKQQCATVESHATQVELVAQKVTAGRVQAEQDLREQELAVLQSKQALAAWNTMSPAGRFFARLVAWWNETSVEYAQMLADVRMLRDQARVQLASAEVLERQWVEARTQAVEQRTAARTKRELAEAQLEAAEATARAAETQLEADRSRLMTEQEEGEARLSALRATIADQKRELGVLQEALALLDRDLAEVKRELARDLVDRAQVVGTTLTGLFLSPHLLKQHWDVVIVDEASMVQIPTVQLAARCAGSHLILIGDPLQLAPVCQFRQELVKYWLGTDIYTLGRYTIEEAGRGEHSCALLPYQSRMHPAICDLIRGPVYHDLLRDRDPQPPRLQLGPYPESPVVVYDTSGQSRTTRPDGGGSRQNLFHVDLVGRLVEKMLASLPNDLLKPECLGMVTPYRPQVRLLEAELRRRNVAEWVRVGTVHTFQGLEFVGVIFDTVDAPGIDLSPFTSDGWGSDAMRLINVAITRARGKLVLVANLDYQLQHAPKRYIMPQVLRIASTRRVVRADTSSW